jgi:hypothetical protein
VSTLQRLAEAAAKRLDNSPTNRRQDQDPPGEAFLPMARVRAQQIWAGMGARAAQKSWERMTHKQERKWVDELVEAVRRDWAQMDDLQKAEWRDLVTHMDMFSRKRGLPRGFSPWPAEILAQAQQDFINWKYAPSTPEERSRAAGDLTMYASMRHQTALQQIQNIR